MNLFFWTGPKTLAVQKTLWARAARRPLWPVSGFWKLIRNPASVFGPVQAGFEREMPIQPGSDKNTSGPKTLGRQRPESEIFGSGPEIK